MQTISRKITLLLMLIMASTIITAEEYNPMDVQTYILDNGLTVYLNEDHNTTSVFGAVVVKGGGKRDPQDATGIAHYLEHLLFKGTEEMGTIDYDQEKLYLDSIQVKYDELGTIEDKTERLAIQTEINRLSVKAGEFAIPNEFDRLLEGMGGTWINAFTSDDVIAYFNKFPGDQIEKWLEVYSHRFEKPVFRLFQSELETVYEEKNRAMDNVFRNVFVTYLEKFYKNHPYGQQTVLGSVDHLKNPSLTKMREYYDTYYVANNMALIISGDFSIDAALPIIKEKFGNWKSGEIPPPLGITEEPFDGREKISKRMTPIKVGMMGFRTVPAGHPDEGKINLCNKILTNGSSTGLIDALKVEGKLMDAGAFPMDYVDMGANNFIFIPKLFFQSLNNAEKLVLGQIDKLKQGDFEDEFFQAVKLTMLREHEENMESMEGRLFTLIDAYTKGKTWEDITEWPIKLEAITKEEVVAVANKYFGDNYLVMHSKMGFPKKHKLEKPKFEPVIPKNTEEKSTFSQHMENVPEGELKLSYIDFKEDVHISELANKINLYHTTNPINSIFSLKVQFGVGTFADPKLQQTAELLNLLGTSQLSFNQFKGELQKIGTTLDVRVDQDYFWINLKGFDNRFEESLTFLADFMTQVKGDDSKIKILLNNAKAGRKMEVKEPSTVGRALRDYVYYGEKSAYLNRMTVKEIKKSTSADYLQSFTNAQQYEADVFYTGKITEERVSKLLLKHIPFADDPMESNSPTDLAVNSWDKDVVYLINDKKAVQSQIYFSVNGNETDENSRMIGEAYNKYFGRGMGSLVFQEIREFRSLAYSTRASYSASFYNGKKSYFNGYVGCQTDKSLDAISVFKDLALNMPAKPERLEQIKSSLIKGINSNRPSFRSFPGMVATWSKQGYDTDPRKTRVIYYENMPFADIVEFQKENISGKPMAITILTDKKRVDMEKLKDYGEIITLKKKDIFN